MKKFFSCIFSWWHYVALVLIAIFSWRWFDFANRNQVELLKPVIEGVVGGLVTSILLLIFATLWKKNITPWVENLLYRDAKIEGVWRGILVPYVGVEQVDKLRVAAAWRIFAKRNQERGNHPSVPKEGHEIETEATVKESGNKERHVKAKLILANSDAKTGNGQEQNGSTNEKPEQVEIKIRVAPIEVRVEIFRIGHTITGNIVEIGGASQVHTYTVNGSFRNLILSGQYENLDERNIDRGSFSLMLRNNGKKFEGFFSSYGDNTHSIHPFRCILKRHGESSKDA